MRKSIKLSKLYFFYGLALIFIVSCNDDFDDPDTSKEEVLFVRYWNLQYSRADVGNLEKIGERLYYSNLFNPGFFDIEGNQHFLAAREYDMRFNFSFSKNLSAGVMTNRNSLIVMPNEQFIDNHSAILTPINIPDLPIQAQMKPGWFEVPNFALNENYIISTWDRNLSYPPFEIIENTFILELNLINSSFGPHVNPFQPILRKIKVDLEVNGDQRLDLITAFSFRDGWIVSGQIGGGSNAFFITKEGSATPISSLDERFVIFSIIEGTQGDLLLTTETGLYYSPEGDIFDFVKIASTNQFLRIKLIEDRLVTWQGRDTIYEIKNYKDSENIELIELANFGLEGLWVKDVELFIDQIFVATNGGLFLKDLDDFWVYKDTGTNEAAQKLGWEPIH